MDGVRFDALTRALRDRGTRRQLVRGSAASALAWLGLARTREPAASQDASSPGITFPVQPICTCPDGLVLCQGLCVPERDCPAARRMEPGQTMPAPASASDRQECPPQEQFCPSRDICVPCPTGMTLDRACACACQENQVSECRARCDCPRVAVCNCVCPGPPCESPKVQHADSCQCVCPNSCPGSLVHDAATCECVCPPGTQRCGDRCVRCPQDATLNPDFCDCVCDTVVVPGNGRTVFSTLVPTLGAMYTIRVSGTFDISLGANRLADAEYVFDPNGNLQTNRCGAFGGDIGLTLDDPTRSRPTKLPPSWGPYNTAHVYTIPYTGTGNPIAFTYNDCNYRDNRGSLTVEILCNCAETVCDPPRVPNGDTCECVCPEAPANAMFVGTSATCDWVCSFATCREACCDPGQVCNTAADPPTCCTPQDACPAGSCGAVPDSCGGTIDRGPCPEQICQIGVCNPNGGCNGCAYARSPDNAPGTLCTTPGAVCCGGACCANGQVCVNGSCCAPGGICPVGFCGDVPDGCGGEIECNCRRGVECCGTSCVNTSADPRNCGVCDRACARGLVCQDGVCVCPTGRTLCNRRCIACPPGGTVNPDYCDCVCDTLLVPTNGSTVSSQLTLVAGQPYTIRVSGTFVIGGGRLADADHVFNPNGDLQLNRCGAYGGDIGLTIDDPTLSKPAKTPQSWGAYTKSHVYTTTYTGKGAPITFTYNDCDYSDNSGTLRVEILCPRNRDGGPGAEATGVAVSGGDDPPTTTPTPTPTTSPTGPTGSTGTVTPSTGGVTGVVGPGGPTPTIAPPPTSTPVPTPTGPPECTDDELLCVDRCIPATDCPADQCCFDAATCNCTCPNCGENSIFDPDDCACVCTLRECPPNYVFDEIGCSCTCQPTACPLNFQFDPASCSCLCVPVACPANFQFDPASCSCVCLPPACPPTYQFDAASCSCFCAETACAEGEIFDLASCACLPSGGTGDVQGTA